MSQIRTTWIVWLVPFIAAIVTVWLLIDFYRVEGRMISIRFDDASGIEAQKTQIKFRGVNVGVVKKVRLSDDTRSVVVSALIDENYENLAVEGSIFSVVKPEVNLNGVTGLSTLIKGIYIVVLPGTIKGKSKSDFVAQSASLTRPLDDTSTYFLTTGNAESISSGDALSFRGIKIGSVTRLDLVRGAQEVSIKVSVDNRYAYLVRQNTRFWIKVGVQADLGLFSSQLKINSLDSVINGGIELATPTNAAPMAENLTSFQLMSKPPEEYEKWNPTLK